MILKPPSTKEELSAIKETILFIMNNPYADTLMVEKLKKKLDQIEIKIQLAGNPTSNTDEVEDLREKLNNIKK